MTLTASHDLTPRGQSPCACREAICTEAGRSRQCPEKQIWAGQARVQNRNPAVNAAEKSDTPIVPKKPLNKGQPAEVVEGRGVTKGNAGESPVGRTQSRETTSMGLKGIREAAKRDKGMKFTALLLHHITPELLADSFYELK